MLYREYSIGNLVHEILLRERLNRKMLYRKTLNRKCRTCNIVQEKVVQTILNRAMLYIKHCTGKGRTTNAVQENVVQQQMLYGKVAQGNVVQKMLYRELFSQFPGSGSITLLVFVLLIINLSLSLCDVYNIIARLQGDAPWRAQTASWRLR